MELTPYKFKVTLTKEDAENTFATTGGLQGYYEVIGDTAAVFHLNDQVRCNSQDLF